MLFVFFNNANTKFDARKFTWKLYITIKTVPIIRQKNFINKFFFAIAAFNKNFKAFVIYIIVLKALKLVKIIFYSFSILKLANV